MTWEGRACGARSLIADHHSRAGARAPRACGAVGLRAAGRVDGVIRDAGPEKNAGRSLRRGTGRLTLKYPLDAISPLPSPPEPRRRSIRSFAARTNESPQRALPSPPGDRGCLDGRHQRCSGEWLAMDSRCTAETPARLVLLAFLEIATSRAPPPPLTRRLIVPLDSSFGLCLPDDSAPRALASVLVEPMLQRSCLRLEALSPDCPAPPTMSGTPGFIPVSRRGAWLPRQ